MCVILLVIIVIIIIIIIIIIIVIITISSSSSSSSIIIIFNSHRCSLFWKQQYGGRSKKCRLTKFWPYLKFQFPLSDPLSSSASFLVLPQRLILLLSSPSKV